MSAGPIDILWGWDAIASALEVDVKTARALAAQEDHPLPVFGTGSKKSVQSTRTALQDWANRRAWALTEGAGNGAKKPIKTVSEKNGRYLPYTSMILVEHSLENGLKKPLKSLQSQDAVH